MGSVCCLTLLERLTKIWLCEMNILLLRIGFCAEFIDAFDASIKLIQEAPEAQGYLNRDFGFSLGRPIGEEDFAKSCNAH